jgi:hypothetical protein
VVDVSFDLHHRDLAFWTCHLYSQHRTGSPNAETRTFPASLNEDCRSRGTSCGCG